MCYWPTLSPSRDSHYLPRHSKALLEYTFTEWRSVEKLRKRAIAPHNSLRTNTVGLRVQFHSPILLAGAWTQRSSWSSPATHLRGTHIGTVFWQCLTAEWVNGGTHLTLVKKGNKKSRVTRSRKGMLFFFFFFEQTNIYFNLVKQLVEALLSSSTLHSVFTLSSFCDKNNIISNPEVSRVSVTSNKVNRTPNTKQNPPWYILTGDLCTF